MEVNRTRSAAVVAAALVLAGCQGDGSDDTSGSAGPTSEAQPKSSSPVARESSKPKTSTAASSSTSAKPPKKTIKSVDLLNTRWTFFPNGERHIVNFRDGEANALSEGEAATFKVRPPFKSDKPTYVDADGDGDLDALVEVFKTQGNGWSIEGYVWLWDAKQEKAVQQQRPVFKDQRCGDVTEKVTFDEKGAATVSYLERVDEVCADQPSKKRSRTLDTRPVTGPFQTKPWPSSLDHCTPSANSSEVYGPADFPPDFPGFRSGPSADAPVVAAKNDVQKWGTYLPMTPGDMGNWVLVWFEPKGANLDATTSEFPCGWLKTGS